MAKKIMLGISFAARWELYVLKIKIGHPFKSKLRIAIEEFPDLFKNKKTEVLIA